MKKQHIPYIMAGLLLSASLYLIPNLSAADSVASPTGIGSVQKDSEKSSEGRKLPFHGRLSAVNGKEQTITVNYSTGDKVFHLTPETKILKFEKPATLEDAVVGEQVSGAYVKQGDRAELTKLTLAKAAESGSEGGKKHSKASKHLKESAK